MIFLRKKIWQNSPCVDTYIILLNRNIFLYYYQQILKQTRYAIPCFLYVFGGTFWMRRHIQTIFRRLQFNCKIMLNRTIIYYFLRRILHQKNL